MALNLSSSTKRKKKGQYCCVVGCHRETLRDGTLRDKDKVSFFRFPAAANVRNPEKRQLWIKAVSRKNDDGSDWEPSEWSRICSDHFVGKWHHDDPSHPDYKPSIFPTSHILNLDLTRAPLVAVNSSQSMSTNKKCEASRVTLYPLGWPSPSC